MSRRESRSSLGSRQNDALLEFESFKKKFLLANKHITKLNSTLSVRIEELNAQISSLYVENLRLRASEIALASQLKREREKSRKIMEEAESATLNLTKHLSYLRQTFGISRNPPSPTVPTSPRACKRPPKPNPSSESPQVPRLSRPPNVPGIFEEDEPYPSSSEHEEPPPNSVRLKTKSKSRVPSSKSVVGPSTEKALGLSEEHKIPAMSNELADVDIEISEIQVPIKRRRSTGKEKEKLEEAAQGFEQIQPPEQRRRTKEKLEENGTDGNTIRDHDVEGSKGRSSLERSPPQRTRLSSPIPPADGESVNGGRERRTRKSVNYAEPKLNTKMRKPDPLSGTTPLTKRKRSSETAVSSNGVFKHLVEDGNEADNDTEARSSLERPQPSSQFRTNDAVINPAFLPLPSSRPSSSSSYFSIPPSDSKSSVATIGLASSMKRKKSKSYIPVEEDDDESEGAQADSEYAPGKSWVNESRRRSGSSKRHVSLSEEERRHSAAV